MGQGKASKDVDYIFSLDFHLRDALNRAFRDGHDFHKSGSHALLKETR